MARPSTGLSPEWDRWFDETFTDLITSDEDLARVEFDALIAASWPPPSPAPPATSGDRRHRGAAEPPGPANTR